MRAFVLAAGLGTRLRPITEQVPKCLAPVGGRPLLSYWIELLHHHGVKHILVNSHHLHEQVTTFIQGIQLPVRIKLAYEPVLLGSAGTLRANRNFAEGVKDFFVIYADTLTNANLTDLLRAHQQMGQTATLGLFKAPVPSECGIVTLDQNGIVVDFQEKPEQPLSDLAFAGVMVASPKLFDTIPDRVPCDLSKDVFRQMIGRMAGWDLRAYVRDIGTLKSYEQAQAEIRQLESRSK